MYCRIVLQEKGYRKIVSQYKNCIVTAEAMGCWTVSQHRAATRPARPRHSAGRADRARARAGRSGSRSSRGAQAGIKRWACWRWARSPRRAGGSGARGPPCRGVAGAQERGKGACGARHGRWARGQARPGRAAGQQAVHLVHSACFWPSLTQYCS